MQYRRLFVPGACYFFTLVSYKRQPIFSDYQNIEILRSAFRQVKTKRPFDIDAIVVMPDHLHCIWSLPYGDSDYSTRWRLIKTWFSKHGYCNNRQYSSHSLWQKRFWEHLIRDEEDYERHVDYIHYNPVKHGYVGRAYDWSYSSFRQFVNKGILSENWGVGEKIVIPESIGNE